MCVFIYSICVCGVGGRKKGWDDEESAVSAERDDVESIVVVLVNHSANEIIFLPRKRFLLKPPSLPLGLRLPGLD